MNEGFAIIDDGKDTLPASLKDTATDEIATVLETWRKDNESGQKDKLWFELSDDIPNYAGTDGKGPRGWSVTLDPDHRDVKYIYIIGPRQYTKAKSNGDKDHRKAMQICGFHAFSTEQWWMTEPRLWVFPDLLRATQSTTRATDLPGILDLAKLPLSYQKGRANSRHLTDRNPDARPLVCASTAGPVAGDGDRGWWRIEFADGREHTLS
ncbi:unnamed protein product [Amoebophrya sp. A120]|nr:unnamed protein product [Amoebophrya sp. A120]|eukprot:GSA120T00016313001.1